MKLPAGFAGEIRRHRSTLRAVVIQGRARYRAPGGVDSMLLEPGSYFGSEVDLVHPISCDAETECIIYLRTRGELDIG